MARFDKNKFKTENQTWETPEELFKLLDNEFNFDIDLSANKQNTKCRKFISKEENALSISWKNCGWLNPPYGGSSNNSLKNWEKKAFEESRKDGCTIVMLIPARTNTIWWHKYCMKAKEIRLIVGRPKFKGCIHGLPQPLAIIVFNNLSEVPILKTQDIHKRKEKRMEE